MAEFEFESDLLGTIPASSTGFASFSMPAEMEKLEGAVTGASVEGEVDQISYVEPTKEEWIVISGGAYSADKGDFQYTFIEPAIKKIRELCDMRNGNDNFLINWAIADAGWQDDDKSKFCEAVGNLPVVVMFIDCVQTLLNYINFGKDRTMIKITYLVVFSHGTLADDETPGPAIALGWYHSNWEALHFVRDHIPMIYTEPCQNPYCEFYSCNTGTGGDYSWAQTWVNLVGGETWAFVGKSEYSYINKIGRLDRAVYTSRQEHGFSYFGSSYYPVRGSKPDGSEAEWIQFTRKE